MYVAAVCAAIAPCAAATMICFSVPVMSPAARSPGMFVLILSSTFMCPFFVVSTSSFFSGVRIGLYPIAMKTPSVGSSIWSSVSLCLSFSFVTFSFPIISVGVYGVSSSMFGVSLILFIIISSALNWFLLWIWITSLHICDRYSVYCAAVFPPPITATRMFLKKYPSHVAQ